MWVFPPCCVSPVRDVGRSNLSRMVCVWGVRPLCLGPSLDNHPDWSCGSLLPLNIILFAKANKSFEQIQKPESSQCCKRAISRRARQHVKAGRPVFRPEEIKSTHAIVAKYFNFGSMNTGTRCVIHPLLRFSHTSLL